MTIRCLTVLLTLVAAALNAGQAYAQHLSSDQACSLAFTPLREEAEKRGKLIKAASDRHAPPDEACKLIKNFGAAEFKMIKYIEANATKCGIPPQIGDQMKKGHANTEKMQNQVCNVAQQAANQKPVGDYISLRPEPARPRGPVGDFELIR